MAANTRSRVRIKHRTEKGETPEVELTPVEALDAATQQDRAKAKAEAKALPDERVAEIQISAPEVRGAVARLQQAGVQNLSASEIQSIVDVAVAVLQGAGAGHLLHDLAAELEMRGMFNFAQAVRQHIRPSGTLEPPLTTT